jgi:hypothetical protein
VVADGRYQMFLSKNTARLRRKCPSVVGPNRIQSADTLNDDARRETGLAVPAPTLRLTCSPVRGHSGSSPEGSVVVAGVVVVVVVVVASVVGAGVTVGCGTKTAVKV